MTAAITNRGSYPEHSKYDIPDFAMPWATARAGLLLRGKVSGPLLRWGVSGYFGLHVSSMSPGTTRLLLVALAQLKDIKA